MSGTASAPPLPGGHAPLYARLRQAIQDRVTSGEWRPGDQLPTIRELGEFYGVSRITVVQALDGLSREGWLRRYQGKGVFVRKPDADAPRLPLRSFTEETRGGGHIPSSRTLHLAYQPASTEVSAHLGLTPGAGVVLLERLRLVDGSPFALQQAYLPEHLVPGLVERREPIDSLYQVLTDTYRILTTTACERYAPINLAPDQARLLETQPGPAFQVDRTTTDQHGRTIEFAVSVLRGDRYEVRLLLSRSPFER